MKGMKRPSNSSLMQLPITKERACIPPLVMLKLVDGQWVMPVEQPRPIAIVRGEGNVLCKDQHLHDRCVTVLFQKWMLLMGS